MRRKDKAVKVKFFVGIRLAEGGGWVGELNLNLTNFK